MDGLLASSKNTLAYWTAVLKHSPNHLKVECLSPAGIVIENVEKWNKKHPSLFFQSVSNDRRKGFYNIHPKILLLCKYKKVALSSQMTGSRCISTVFKKINSKLPQCFVAFTDFLNVGRIIDFSLEWSVMETSVGIRKTSYDYLKINLCIILPASTHCCDQPHNQASSST
jgi:hypothetical protein